jgi:eukaryotic-like serine/threonine-protein kinase
LLYRGQGPLAIQFIRQNFPKFESTVRHFQLARMLCAYTAGCAQILAADDIGAALAQKQASSFVKLLGRENARLAQPLALILQSGIATLRDDVGRLVPDNFNRLEVDLRRAMHSFEAFDLPIFCHATRHRLGELVGGQQGRELVYTARQWMAEHGIINPEKMVSLFAPGKFSRKPLDA